MILLPLQAAPANGEGLGGLTGAPVPELPLPPLGKGAATLEKGSVEFEMPVEEAVIAGAVAEVVYIGAEVGNAEEVVFGQKEEVEIMSGTTEGMCEVTSEVWEA